MAPINQSIIAIKPMTRLSVNINKIALIRNARGGNIPDLLQVARDCERFGAEGITVHPRPDQRHIRYTDVQELKKILKTEFNVEGNPGKTFMELVIKTKPDQVTLVPDAADALTSDHGWDTLKHGSFLSDIVSELKENQIRSSVFLDPNIQYLEAAKETGCDRIELYTESYAKNFKKNREEAIKPYLECALEAKQLQIGLNAGHDLNLENLSYFKNNIPDLLEVSIGHALISEALYYGLENIIQLYLKALS
jgi:pyridoxine 5-phosphate synthase